MSKKMKSKPLSYDVYQKLAPSYSSLAETKPHNAYYERPAMLSLLPDITGMHVLDAGCGPGIYTAELLNRGATVIACDASDRMLEYARQRSPGKAKFLQLDLSQPLDSFTDEEFDLVNAPLCMDYIEDWSKMFKEFFRVLKPGGWFLFSCGHPAFDAEYFNTSKYFSVELVHATWRGFGQHVEMPSYRRSLEEMITPIVQAGFLIDRVHEPLPTEDFRKSDLRRYLSLMQRPSFVCFRLRKPEN